MKRIFTLLLITTAAVSFTVLYGLDEVISALKSGNASQVARYFDNTVELSLPGKAAGSTYSKSQAELVLKDFFAAAGVKDFVVMHRGENAGSQFCVGTLITRSGSYRTNFFMKQKGGVQVLQELILESK